MKGSVLYHDVFSYPLRKEELIKWETNFTSKKKIGIEKKKGFYFIAGREEIITKRFLREKISKGKLKIAKRASKLIAKLPTVQMVGVTGSLAMLNSDQDSDIDLIIITKSGTMWMSRLLVYGVLKVGGFQLRKVGSEIGKDELCLNMWMDVGDLKIRKRNIYTAHEIAQIRPLVNKNKTYERLLVENKWVLDYWPNAVKIKPTRKLEMRNSKFGIIEKLAYWVQYRKMKAKITRETVTKTRAFFHPFDWGEALSHIWG